MGSARVRIDQQPGVALLAVAVLVCAGCVNGSTRSVCSSDPSLGPVHGMPCADRNELEEQPLAFDGEQIAHTVSAGETLSQIASRYRVGVAAIRQLNRILDPDRIEVGQRLWLPSSAVLSSRSPSASEGPPEPTRAAALLIEAEQQYLDARFDSALERSREVESLLIEAEQQYLDARFDSALERSQEVESLLSQEPEGKELRARAAFVAGSALAGLGEEQRASEQFARVRVLDPGFDPPTGWLSPRLGELYGSASAR